MPISGTIPVTRPIAPTDALDTFATHDEVWGKGGFRSVADATARNAITTARRSAGMLVQTLDTGVIHKLGADLSTWTAVTSADTAYSAALTEYALFDDFARADVAAGGSLGSPVTGGDAWTVLTQGGVNPSSDVYLEGGALRLDRASTSGLAYLVREFTSAPTIMGCEIVFEDTATPLGPASATFCMSVTTKENGTWIDNLVHCLISESGLSLQTGFHGPNFIQHATTKFASGDIVRGRRYNAEIIFDGSLCILRLDRWYCVARDPRIGRNHGRYGYWEWYNETSDSGNRVALHSVWTKRVATAPAREPARTSYGPPTIAGGVYFDGGSARSVSDLAALTSLGTSDFTVFWRGRIPARPAQIQANATNTAALWCLGSKTTGPSLVMDYTPYLPRLLFRLPTDGSNHRERIWYEGSPGWPAGQVTDFTLRRKGATVELYQEGAYSITNYPDVETGTAPAWSATVASGSLIVGNRDHTTSGGEGWFGTIYDCAVANCALTGPDMIALQNGVIPERLKWATNTPLSSGVSLTVGKCYRLGTIGTSGYWFTGCTAGDTFQILAAAEGNVTPYLAATVRNTGLVYATGSYATDSYTGAIYQGDDSTPGGVLVSNVRFARAMDLETEEFYALKRTVTDGSNTATQIGLMVALSGQERDTVFRDLSTNAKHGVLSNGAASQAEPVKLETRIATTAYPKHRLVCDSSTGAIYRGDNNVTSGGVRLLDDTPPLITGLPLSEAFVHLRFRNGQAEDLKGNAWSVIGSPTFVAADGLLPESISLMKGGAGETPARAGDYLQLSDGSAADVLDVQQFMGVIVFRPTTIDVNGDGADTNARMLMTNMSGVAGTGWQLVCSEVAGTRKLKFFVGSGSPEEVLPTPNEVNVCCFGADASIAFSYLRLNNRPMKQGSGVGAVIGYTATPAKLGVHFDNYLSFAGNIYEIWIGKPAGLFYSGSGYGRAAAEAWTNRVIKGVFDRLGKTSVEPGTFPTYGATVAIDCSAGNLFTIVANNATAFAIAAPTNLIHAGGGRRITIRIKNTHTDALGTITWNAVFKMAAFVSPATGYSKSLDFHYDGTNWIQTGPASEDIPN